MNFQLQNYLRFLFHLELIKAEEIKIENARFFEKNGFAKVVVEEDFATLPISQIDEFYNNLEDYKHSMQVYKK